MTGVVSEKKEGSSISVKISLHPIAIAFMSVAGILFSSYQQKISRQQKKPATISKSLALICVWFYVKK